MQQGMGGMNGGMGGGAATGNMLSGTVKAWMDDKGFGFISPADGGDDLFVHRSSLEDGQMLVVGASVMYESAWNAQKGKNAVTRLVGAAPGEGKGCKGGGKGKGGGSYGMGGMGGGCGGPAPGQGPGRYTGSVKAWYDEKGFGFILPDGGGDDVFVHRNALTDGSILIQGANVSYTQEWNDQKGKFSAAEVMGAAPGEKGGKGKKGGGKGKGKDDW